MHLASVKLCLVSQSKDSAFFPVKWYQMSLDVVFLPKGPDPFQQRWCAKEPEALGRGQQRVDILRQGGRAW